MIMPFIRLISIYVIVILAVVAFFKRDQIMELTGWSFSQEDTEDTADAGTPVEPDSTPVSSVEPPAAEQPDQPETTPAEAAESGAAKQPVQQASIQQPQPSPASAEQVATDTQTRLTQARQTYWNGDLAGAEALYSALLRDDPTNPDVNGELGNIFYAQRRYGEAADAYLATGKLLIDMGNRARAMPLLPVLQSIAPQKAAELHALMIN